MINFQYRAIHKNGKTVKGTIKAESKKHAANLIKNKGLTPIALVKAKDSPIRFLSSKISAQDLALFTRQFSTLLAAGIPIEESLQGVIEQTQKNKVKQIIINVRAKVLEGYSLAKAMRDFPDAFPELYCATVNSGEQTGNLDLVLEKLADYTEKQQETKKKIQQALIYPSLMVIVSISIVAFLMVFVVPKIINVFTQSNQTLPVSTIILIKVSDFLTNHSLSLLTMIFTIVVSTYFALRYEKVKWYYHALLLKIPLISYMIKTINISRYIHTFSILFSAGVSVLETMSVSTKLIHNKVMREKFEEAVIDVREGQSINYALKKTNFLSPMTLHLIANGEKSGLIAEIMGKVSAHLDTEINRLIDTMLALLEPLIILFMGAIVLFIVMATLVPIFSMQQLVA